jgi:hypothetical protein
MVSAALAMAALTLVVGCDGDDAGSDPGAAGTTSVATSPVPVSTTITLSPEARLADALDRAFDETGSPIACAQDNALGIGNAFTSSSPTTIRFQHEISAAVPGQRVTLRLLGFPCGDVRAFLPNVFELLVEEGCWTLRYGTRQREDPYEFVTGRAVPLDKTGLTPSTREAVYDAQPIRPQFALVTPPAAGHYLFCISIHVLDSDGNLFEHRCTRVEVIRP